MESPHFNGRNIEKIIWDADNTFWNWVKYAAKAYQATAECIAKETGIPKEEVIPEMKNFYSQAGTMEDAGLIQGLEASGLFKKAKKYDRQKLISAIRLIFNDCRHFYLKLYANMGYILGAAKRDGRENIVLSDAPAFHAVRRLIRSHLEKNISRLYARPSRKIDNLPDDVVANEQTSKYDAPFDVIEVSDEKPDTNLKKVLRIEGSKEQIAAYIREHVAIIGDSRTKDMTLAEKWGCVGLHALWGIARKEDLEILKQFAPEKITERNSSKENDLPYPEDSRIIPVPHPYLLLKILDL
jgi:phosphoglycolate phosphatase-like HAD superfamily hydrolase